MLEPVAHVGRRRPQQRLSKAWPQHRWKFFALLAAEAEGS
jgi:hypothetical protein